MGLWFTAKWNLMGALFEKISSPQTRADGGFKYVTLKVTKVATNLLRDLRRPCKYFHFRNFIGVTKLAEYILESGDRIKEVFTLPIILITANIFCKAAILAIRSFKSLFEGSNNERLEKLFMFRALDKNQWKSLTSVSSCTLCCTWTLQRISASKDFLQSRLRRAQIRKLTVLNGLLLLPKFTLSDRYLIYPVCQEASLIGS